jgi:hypothetical protein
MPSPSFLRVAVVGVLVASISGCVTPGPHLRVATASVSDFEKVKDENVVWYEFQPGDSVPFNLLFFGVLEGGATDITIRAKKPFFLVARKGAPMMLSFDGENISYRQVQSIIAVVPRKDGQGGEVGWMNYLGESNDPEKELETLVNSTSRQ